jgi:flagellum-specific peptidoglycan hydrolase FlgJ
MLPISSSLTKRFNQWVEKKDIRYTLVKQGHFLNQNAFNLLMCTCLLYVLFQKNISIQIVSVPETVNKFWNDTERSSEFADLKKTLRPTAMASVKPIANEAKRNNKSANDFANVAFLIDPESKRQSDIPPEIVAEKQRICLEYVQKYRKFAEMEEARYGIPTAITLAQGLLESDAGASRLTRNNQNHFGIKCFSTHCKKGHCSNYTDDTHKDFFRRYDSAWESFREHSLLLQKPNYRPLYRLQKSDIGGWARGLKSCGYATDKNYAKKLLLIVEGLGLKKLRKEGSK